MNTVKKAMKIEKMLMKEEKRNEKKPWNNGGERIGREMKTIEKKVKRGEKMLLSKKKKEREEETRKKI